MLHRKQNMNYSKNGLALTESFEGVRLTAYQDIRGVWTTGYGHTGPDVRPGMTITQAQAEQLLLADVAHAVSMVNRCVTVSLDQNQFDALVDFAFNAGCEALDRREESGLYCGPHSSARKIGARPTPHG
jgi:lysozyme